MSESTNTTLSGLAIAVSVCGVIVGAINHKRIRSRCCGRNLDVSVDIENTTPKEETIKNSDDKK